MSIFSDFWLDFFFFFFFLFFLMHHQTIKKKKRSKDKFSIIHFVRTECELHIFNYTDALQTWHTTTLWCLYFVYICWSRSGLKKKNTKKHTQYFIQKQCTMCAAFTDANASRLLSCRSFFSCILLPLCLFRAATCNQQLQIQTCHIWRWLTSVKLQKQSWCSLV